MMYIVAAFLGMILGGAAGFIIVHEKRQRLATDRRELEMDCERARAASRGTADQLRDRAQSLAAKEASLVEQETMLKRRFSEFDAQVVSYRDLQTENSILKSSLRQGEIVRRKQAMQQDELARRQAELDERGRELASRYLKENVKWIGSVLTPNNFAASKQRLLDVVSRCRDVGFPVSPDEEARLVADLKSEFERLVRAAFEREEQGRIKARIREEQAREREVQREIDQVERERMAIRAALDKALAEAHDTHSAEIDRLRSRLADAEARAARAVAQAQLTRAGHVYVISNVGTFGDDVFKIGMTRRLEPVDRVRELGDASVPFPFDVHMMISCNDAPALENALHKAFHKSRLNKVNPRKEFFRVTLADIGRVVEENHGKVEFVADAAALEYRQSLTISDDDQEYIESVFDRVADDGDVVDD